MKRFKFIGYLDTENDPQGNITLCTLILNVPQYGDTFEIRNSFRYTFFSRGEALLRISKLKNTLLYTHNLEYDLVNLFGKAFADIGIVFLKNRLVYAKWQGITFYDSFLHFTMPLAAIGKSVGLLKLKTDIHSEKYAMRDVEILEKAFTLLQKKVWSISQSFVGATSGSTAVKVWKYLTQENFVLGHYDPPLARESYYGGRTEIFRKTYEATSKTDGVFGYDVNSMYPAVMRYRYPTNLVKDETFKLEYGLIDADFSISETAFVGLLPVRVAGRLIYPTGKFRTTVTYHEARQAGISIDKIHSSYGTNNFCQPFLKFVDTIYPLRLAAKDDAEKLVWKIILNSLYGKMVSRGEIFIPMDEEQLFEKLDKEKSWRDKRNEQLVFSEIGNRRYLVASKRPPEDYVNVLWGSYITSYARILLNKILSGNASRLMYADTDSCYLIGKKSIEGIELGKNLGAVKLEKEAQAATFLLPKLYYLLERKNGKLKESYTAKGIPAPMQNFETLERNQEYRKAFFRQGQATFELPTRYRQTVRSNIAREKRGEVGQRLNLWEQKTKRLGTKYFKHLHGNEYWPLRLPRDQIFIEKLAKTSFEYGE